MSLVAERTLYWIVAGIGLITNIFNTSENIFTHPKWTLRTCLWCFRFEVNSLPQCSQEYDWKLTVSDSSYNRLVCQNTKDDDDVKNSCGWTTWGNVGQSSPPPGNGKAVTFNNHHQWLTETFALFICITILVSNYFISWSVKRQLITPSVTIFYSWCSPLIVDQIVSVLIVNAPPVQRWQSYLARQPSQQLLKKETVTWRRDN